MGAELEIAVRQHFAADQTRVFAWLQTPRNWAVLEDVIETRGDGTPWTDSSLVFAPNIEVRYQVVEYEPPDRVVNVSQDLEGRVITEELTFEPYRNGTEVVSSIQVAGDRMGVLERIYYRRQLLAQTRSNMAAMARALNQRAR